MKMIIINIWAYYITILWKCQHWIFDVCSRIF